MRYVLDACVAVGSARPSEKGHAEAKARVARVLEGLDEILIPSLFTIEVVSALSRAKVPSAEIWEVVDPLVDFAEVVTIGPRTARSIARMVLRTHLKAADAAYVWLAAREGVPLVTADEQIHTRAGAMHCTVERP